MRVKSSTSMEQSLEKHSRLWEPQYNTTKIGILLVIVSITVGVHYGWLIQPIFGKVLWLHAIHGRFCYVPIVMAAVWYGLRGGLSMASLISVVITPYILTHALDSTTLVKEIAEIVIYFGVAVLAGVLIDLENKAQRRAERLRLDLEQSYQLSLAGRIAAGVAHEIKNPLASIRGAAEILTDERTPQEEKLEFRDILLREVRRIDGTVINFLQLARPADPLLGVCELGEAVTATIKQLTPQAAKQQIDFFSEGAGPFWIKGDSERIHQVLLNLLLNAIDASAPGDRISVSLERDEKKREIITIIKDEGCGMSPESIERAFEPFYSTKSHGTGLGLALVNSIIVQHGGSVSINSRVEEGTTVAIRLLMQGNE